MHKEINEEDIGLPRRVKRKNGKFKYFKTGWIEEIYNKLRNINIEIIDSEGFFLVQNNNNV